MRTYIFKLYKAKRNKKLHKVINIAGIIYNPVLLCIKDIIVYLKNLLISISFKNI